MSELDLNQLQPVERLREIMRMLRSEDGCPWDKKQTLQTLRPYLVEETYEVLDAIDSGVRADLCEELGDLLLQIVFQTQLCDEEGSFNLDDVATSITDKMIRRHPHVFGEVEVADADEVLKNWDEIKKKEKGEHTARSVMDGVPRHLPALHRAYEIQKRASRQGFDWSDMEDVLIKIDEEFSELREAMAAQDAVSVREELGDLLFTIVNYSRFLGHQPEDALHDANRKFIARFQTLENQVHDQGKVLSDFTLTELDKIWDDVKAKETRGKAC